MLFKPVLKMDRRKFINILKKIWYFIWEEDSLLSWIVNIILAIVLIKYIIYPGLGLVLGTHYPIVAVVSDSMEHRYMLDDWWAYQSTFYIGKNISFEEFKKFPFNNGFNKGDLMVLIGTNPEKIKIGDIIVFMAGKPDPIIHRVVALRNSDGDYVFETKGDNNVNQITSTWLNEKNVSASKIVGKAVFRIPYLGWVKIGAVELLSSLINILR